MTHIVSIYDTQLPQFVSECGKVNKVSKPEQKNNEKAFGPRSYVSPPHTPQPIPYDNLTTYDILVSNTYSNLFEFEIQTLNTVPSKLITSI